MIHHRLASCSSTNDEARRAFEEGAALPLLISAEEQTAGRGRQGRSWSQLQGNFAGSFLIEGTRALVQNPGVLSLLAGLAVRDALIANGAQGSELTLKWPNDVLRQERKVAGILAEFLEDSHRRAFIIGIGVNLAKAPDDTPFPAARAFDNVSPGPAAFGDELGSTLLGWVRFAEKDGSEAVLTRWRDHGWRLGEPLAVRTGETVTEGIFEDIDNQGHIVLRLPEGGLRTISAGDAVRR